MKLCSYCKETKPLNEFHVDARSKTGKASRCKTCAKMWSKRWYKESDKYKDIIRDSGLKNRYGIDSDYYWQLSEDQNHVCAICKTKGNQKYLHVDHNHDTGEIRGLLCKTCNHGLGNFRDNEDLLKSAIEYLDKNSAGN
jgi:hypothetical protein